MNEPKVHGGIEDADGSSHVNDAVLVQDMPAQETNVVEVQDVADKQVNVAVRAKGKADVICNESPAFSS